MKVKRFKVGNKYLYTFIDHKNEFTFRKKNNNIMMWTKKEIVYLQKALNVMGQEYIRQYYCK
jgi:hypothetical protein